MEQVAAPAQRAGAQHLRRVALPRVLVAVEADQAAEQEHRQADVRIDAEHKAVQRVHARAPWSGRSLADDRGSVAAGRAWPGLWTSSRRRPAARPSFRRAARRPPAATGCAFSPASSSSAPSTLAYALSRLLQRAEDRVEDVRDLAQKGARLARRLGRDELEHDRQVVGQLAWRQEEAGLLVGLRQIDHRRPAVARVAVHVLEQVQRGGAAAVEQFDVVGLGCRADRRAASDSISASSSARRAARQRALAVQQHRASRAGGRAARASG